MPNYWVPGQERFKPSWRPGLPMRGPTLLTMPGEIRNQIYDTLISEWDGGVLHFPAGVRGRERGGEVSGPQAGTRFVDLLAFSQTCKLLRGELRPLIKKHFPTYRARAPLDKMEEFFDETDFDEIKISSVFFWTTRSDNKPIDYMGETYDLSPIIMAQSVGVTVITEHKELQEVLAFWTHWDDLCSKGYLLDISFTTYVKHGFKLNYIVSDEIGTMWQARGFKETESQFPEIAFLNTSNALFKSGPWGDTVRILGNEGVMGYDEELVLQQGAHPHLLWMLLYKINMIVRQHKSNLEAAAAAAAN